MGIDYDSDLVKHFVRTDGWLPLCRRRLATIRREEPKKPRRLRYFTFCAVGAVDVLMLNVAKIVTLSTADRFDKVFFFGRDEEAIIETEKRIPGAIGFPGNFVDVVLLDVADEALLEDGADPLDSPEDDPDIEAVRHHQQTWKIKREFFNSFPFDVINLDLEEFVFKPKEGLPGKMVKAMRKVFAWQRQPLEREKGRPPAPIDEFSLMFTTQIGPPNMTADCLKELEGNLARNLDGDERLPALLRSRSGFEDVVQLKDRQFETFFKLSMPKVIAGILHEQDWYVEPENGIKIYQYERDSRDGAYQMLNFVMDVKRQHPPQERRLPIAGNNSTAEAMAAYKEVSFQLFRDKENLVVEAELGEEVVAALRKSLEDIKRRRRKFCPEA